MPNEMNVNIGNSGEYFVAGELERRGYTVAVPMSNVKDFDIITIYASEWDNFVEITDIYDNRTYVSCREADDLIDTVMTLRHELAESGEDMLDE